MRYEIFVHHCAQKVHFYCARIPRIFGFSRTYSTDIKIVKIGDSEKGKALFRKDTYLLAYSTSVKLCLAALTQNNGTNIH
jgi:hypothetical protein